MDSEQKKINEFYNTFLVIRRRRNYAFGSGGGSPEPAVNRVNIYSGCTHESWEIPNTGRNSVQEAFDDHTSTYGTVNAVKNHGDHGGGTIYDSTQSDTAWGAWFGALASAIYQWFKGHMGNHDADRGSPDPGNKIWPPVFYDPMDHGDKLTGHTFKRFAWTQGNSLHIHLSDANWGSTPVGTFNGGADVGYPEGGLEIDQWRQAVEWCYKYQRTHNIYFSSHQAPKNTNAGSGYFSYDDPTYGLHGGARAGAYMGWAAAIAYIVPDSGYPLDALNFVNNFLDNHPGLIDMWTNAHIHPKIDQTISGVPVKVDIDGTTFLAVSPGTKSYGGNYDPVTWSSEHTENIGSSDVTFKQWLHFATSVSGTYSRGEIVSNRFTKTFRVEHKSVPDAYTPPTPNAVSSIVFTPTGNDVESSWDGDSDCYMILENVSSSHSDLPVNDTGYLIGDTIGTSTIRYIGTLKTAAFKSIGNKYFKIIPFNFGGGSIIYNTVAVSTNVNIAAYDDTLFVTADQWCATRFLTGLSSNDPVNDMADSSGNGNDFGTPGNSPIYRTDVPDPAGHPVIRFNPTGVANAQYMTSPIVVSGTGGFTLLIVVKINAKYTATNNDSIIELNDNSGANITNIRLSTQSEVNVKGLDLGTNVEVPTGTWAVFEITMPANGGADDVIIKVNNFTQNTQSANTTAINIANAGGIDLGRLASVPRYAQFDYAEHCLWSGPLTESERQAAREQLAFIHGINL